jgi:anti-sigma B factor antagonist
MASVDPVGPQRDPTEFEVVRRESGTVCVLVVRGEIDIARARRLGSAINEVLGTGRERLVIDLCDVEFVDSSALAVLVHARRRALRQDIELRLVCDVRSTLRVLAVTQLDRVFDIHRSREQALR